MQMSVTKALIQNPMDTKGMSRKQACKEDFLSEERFYSWYGMV